MSTASRSSAAARRVIDALRSDRAASIAHYASLVIGFAIVAYVGRTQWFFYDEWGFMWNPQERLWAGHAGHWSTVPILIWMAMQATLGLSSYLPYLFLEILTHVVAAHLLWRVLNRVGAARWISTGLVAVFLVLGAGAENLLWGFQYGYIGAIACGLGALLIALRPRLGTGGIVAIAGLLVLGAATSGTVIPLFLPVALVLWRSHGWRATLLGVGIPVVVYLGWYFLVAGPNANSALRAQGVEILLVPQFMGFMFVEGIGRLIPLPYIGAVVTALIGIWIMLVLRRRLTPELMAVVGLVGAAVVFAAMTGYSRWGTTLESASATRYVYFLYVTLAAAVALMFTRVIRDSGARLLLALGLIAFTGVYNLGTLITTARADAAREDFGHQAISAALEMSERFPGMLDEDASPEPVYVKLSFSTLQALHERDGLTAIDYSPEAWLTALVNLGLTTTDAASPASCTPVEVGTRIPSGAVVSSEADDVWLRVAAVDDAGLQGQPRSILLEEGGQRLETLDDSALVVTEPPAGDVCVGDPP